MKTGALAEAFPGENRVAMTPDSATQLAKLGHTCVIESGAGAKAGFSDAAYAAAGVTVLSDAKAVFDAADVVVKVRELAPEMDIVITTALIPGRPAPKLWTEDLVKMMKPGSVIIDLAAERGCLRLVEEAPRTEGITSKARSTASGQRSGAAALSRGQIHYLLTNPIYRGLIRHKSALHQGRHPAIIDAGLWDRVQAKLQLAGSKPRGRKAQQGVQSGARAQQGMAAPLIGKLRDETGDHLTPSHIQRHGRRYVYCVSNRLLAGGTDPTGWRLPAEAPHQLLRRTLVHRFAAAATEHRLLAHPDASRAAAVAAKGIAVADRCKDGSDPLCFDLIATIALRQGAMEIALSPAPLAAALGIPMGDLATDLLRLTAAFARKRRGVESRLISGQTEPSPDATLTLAAREPKETG